MKDYRTISLRYLKAHRRRTILTILGIILSVTLISAVQILYVSFMDFQEREARATADYHGYFRNIDYDKAVKIENFVDVKDAVYMRNEGLTYIVIDEINNRGTFIAKGDKVVFEKGDGGRYWPLRVKGLDDKGFNRFKVQLLEGRLPENDGEIVLREETIKLLNGVKLGDNVKIPLGTMIDENGKEILENNWSQNDNFVPKVEKAYKVVGIAKNNWIYPGDSDIAFTTLKGDIRGDYNVFIDVRKPRDTYKIAEEIGKSLGLSKSEDYRFQGNESLLMVYGGSKDNASNLAILLTIGLITGIIVISTVAVIYNSFNISIIEKSSEYGMLRAVGASPKQIRGLVLQEAALMSVIGIPLGILGGFIGIKLLLTIFGMLNAHILSKLDLRIIIKPGIFITSILISALTIYISAAIPAKRAARVSPVEALKSVERNINIKKKKRSKIIRLLFGPEGEIAYKNLSRNKKRFIITVFSLALSVTLYIAFDSFVNQMSDVTSAQLAKYSYDAVIGKISESQRIINEIEKMENVEKVVSRSDVFIDIVVPENKVIEENVWWNDGKGADKSLILYNSSLRGVNLGYINMLKNHVIEGKIDKNELDEGGVILLQKNVVPKDGKTEYLDFTSFKPGDFVVFADASKSDKGVNEELEKGELKKAKIIGVINDLPVIKVFPSQGLLMITTEKGLQSLNMKPQNSYMYIIKKPNTDGSSIVKYLNNLKENGVISYYYDMEAKAEADRQMLMTVSILLYSFITLIILISSVNIFNSISSNLFIRKKELGVIKSVGMSQGSLRKMIYLEGFYYGFFSIIYGGFIGTGLSYIFYRITNISQNVKWSVNIRSIVTASIGVMLITALSTYLPLKKLNTASIIESIRNEE